MDYGFKYVKEAFHITIKEFLVVILFIVIMSMPFLDRLAGNSFAVMMILSVLYYITFVWYFTAGTYGHLYQYSDNPKLSFSSLKNIANKYYIPFVKVYVFLLILGILFSLPFRLFGFYNTIDINSSTIWYKLSILSIPTFLLAILTVYAYPFIFVKCILNSKAIIYDFRYFTFVIHNK